MEKTIFEKIADHEIPSYIIDENDQYMAFLDINPSSYGQTLVIPKKQHNPYIFKNDDDFIQDFILYVKKIGLLLDEKLGSFRCVLLFEGLEINHLHAKLYPLFDGKVLNIYDNKALDESDANLIMNKVKS